jgi:hypothetical protein
MKICKISATKTGVQWINKILKNKKSHTHKQTLEQKEPSCYTQSNMTSPQMWTVWQTWMWELCGRCSARKGDHIRRQNYHRMVQIICENERRKGKQFPLHPYQDVTWPTCKGWKTCIIVEFHKSLPNFALHPFSENLNISHSHFPRD